jgi:hypothetical protein
MPATAARNDLVIRIASDEFEAEAKRQKLLDAYAEELDADNVKFVFGFGSSIAIEAGSSRER